MNKFVSCITIALMACLLTAITSSAQNVKFDKNKIDALAKELGMSSEKLTSRLTNIYAQVPEGAKLTSVTIDGHAINLESLLYNSASQGGDAIDLTDPQSIAQRIEAFAKENNISNDQAAFMLGLEYVEPAFASDAVDLGLSVKWASCNLAASSPEQFGEFYAWGELKSKDKYVPRNFWYNRPRQKAFLTLPSEFDVAYNKLGGNWRMPTKQEFEELITYCIGELTTYNGVEGMKFTSKKNGKSIFLPSAHRVYSNGTSMYYWSSSLCDFSSGTNVGPDCVWTPTSAFALSPGKNGEGRIVAVSPEHGLFVRPVCE